MKTSTWVVPILVVFIMGFTGAAQAEDFSFTVPLRLNNLHAQVESARVFCQALNASGALVGGGTRSSPSVRPEAFQAMSLWRSMPSQIRSQAMPLSSGAGSNYRPKGIFGLIQTRGPQ